MTRSEIRHNSFRWGDLDHRSIEDKLRRLKTKIERDIQAGERLSPIPDNPSPGSFKGHRQAHSFEMLQQERADDWVAEAYKIYCDEWQSQGGEKNRDFVNAVWCNAVYYFITDDVLRFLRLVFCVDDRTNKLLGKHFSGLPQSTEAHARVQAVNRIYGNVLKLWGENRIPHEANALKVAISAPDPVSTSVSSGLPKVSEVSSPAAAPIKRYDRTYERELRSKLAAGDPDGSLRQKLWDELSKQQRVAEQLVGLQGPQLAISIFGRTDLEIDEEIRQVRIEMLLEGSRNFIENSMAIEHAEADSLFNHSETYDSITFKGKNYTLLERQAAAVRLMKH